jgi:hypothetical protein
MTEPGFIAATIFVDVSTNASSFSRWYNAYFFGNQLWGRLPRNESSGNDDVHFTALFHKKFHLCFDKLFGHFFGISALTSTVLLYLYFDKLRA